MKDYVAFDLETTGLSPDSDQIIEIYFKAIWNVLSIPIVIL